MGQVPEMKFLASDLNIFVFVCWAFKSIDQARDIYIYNF